MGGVRCLISPPPPLLSRGGGRIDWATETWWGNVSCSVNSSSRINDSVWPWWMNEFMWNIYSVWSVNGKKAIEKKCGLKIMDDGWLPLTTSKKLTNQLQNIINVHWMYFMHMLRRLLILGDIYLKQNQLSLCSIILPVVNFCHCCSAFVSAYQ